MHPIFHGLLFGLIFNLFIGPAFFALIQTSIQKGLKPAIFFALGISFSDIFFVVLVVLGVSSILDDETSRLWMGSIGSAILIVYGVYTWFKTPPSYKELEVGDNSGLFKYWLKGALLNGLNPFIVFFWISWVSFASVNYNYSGSSQGYFFSGVLMIILTSDITKAIIANRNKHLLNPKIFKWLNKIVAVVLLLFAVRILYFLISNA